MDADVERGHIKARRGVRGLSKRAVLREWALRNIAGRRKQAGL